MGHHYSLSSSASESSHFGSTLLVGNGRRIRAFDTQHPQKKKFSSLRRNTLVGRGKISGITCLFGSLVSVCSLEDTSVRLYDFTRNKIIGELRDQTHQRKPASDSAFFPRRRVLAVGDTAGSVHLWRVNESDFSDSSDLNSRIAPFPNCRQDGRLSTRVSCRESVLPNILLIGTDGWLSRSYPSIWDLGKEQLLTGGREIDVNGVLGTSQGVVGLDVSNGGDLIAVAYREGLVQLLDTRTYSYVSQVSSQGNFSSMLIARERQHTIVVGGGITLVLDTRNLSQPVMEWRINRDYYSAIVTEVDKNVLALSWTLRGKNPSLDFLDYQSDPGELLYRTKLRGISNVACLVDPTSRLRETSCLMLDTDIDLEEFDRIVFALLQCQNEPDFEILSRSRNGCCVFVRSLSWFRAIVWGSQMTVNVVF